MYAPSPNELLIEFDQINQAILASKAVLQTMTARCESLTNVLDELTRPSIVQPRSITQPQVLPRKVYRGFDYRGKYYYQETLIDIHLAVLRKLWDDFPEKRDAIAAAVGAAGYSRRYISKDRGGLFDGKSISWIAQFSTELADGWYADTNINRERIRRLLPIAVNAAGLKWGSDVRVYWNTTTVSTAAN